MYSFGWIAKRNWTGCPAFPQAGPKIHNVPSQSARSCHNPLVQDLVFSGVFFGSV